MEGRERKSSENRYTPYIDVAPEFLCSERPQKRSVHFVNKSGRVFKNENFGVISSTDAIFTEFYGIAMTKKEKILRDLRDAGGSLSRSQITNQTLQKNSSSSELDELLSTVLSGLVEIKGKKWTLTQAGWSEANIHATGQEVEPAQTEAIPDDFSRFRSIAKENPDSSAQRLLQLAGRHLGDPLEDSEHWREFKAEHPEWYLAQPQTWYARDVELDSDGYPMRCPENPLTAKDRETRPTTEAGWFERAMRSPGASLEPLSVAPMPAFEVANVIRVSRKVGMVNAVDIFRPEKIATAHRLAGLSSG
jgi:hypothetical protein